MKLKKVDKEQLAIINLAPIHLLFILIKKL